MRKWKWMTTLAAAALLSTGMAMTALAAGWSQSGDGGWYYYESDGYLLRDSWKKDGDNYYYLGGDGRMVTNSLIDGSYYVDGNGLRVRNTWIQAQDDEWSGDVYWYYFGSDGKAVDSGWRNIGGVYYYFENGHMKTGWVEDGNYTYYLDDSGAMATGWRYMQQDEDSWEEFWYYFGTNGRMVKSREQKINGVYYIFDDHGRMLERWVDTNTFTSSKYNKVTEDINSLKYYNEGGARADGWMQLLNPGENEENWYYFRDGKAYTPNYKTTAVGDGYGMASIGGRQYCFDSNGHMVTGMLELSDGRLFYFGSDGAMQTGRVVVNDDEYDNAVFYFTESGKLGSKGNGFTGVKSGTLYEDGALVCAEEGTRYQVVTVEGQQYLVNESGKIRTSGTVTDADGVKYKVAKRSDGTYEITIVEE